MSSNNRALDDAVEPIVAPSYRMYPDTSESQQIEAAMRTYGVRSVTP
jgi:hypothetical protein